MKNEKTIFGVLLKKNIPFAVGVANYTFVGEGVDENSKDYFLLIHEKDYKHVKDYKFKTTQNTIKNTFEYSLLNFEVAEFKNQSNKFIKVQHDENGRIYELIGNPFKDYYKNNLKLKS